MTSDAEELARKDEPAVAPPRGVSFLKLREGRCKFPLGSIDEPPTLFCGARTEIGAPYCPDCGRIAYVPSRRR